MADLQKVLNAIEIVLSNAEDQGYHEALAGHMFVTFERPDESDPLVKWQYTLTGWGLLTALLANNKHICFRKAKMVKKGESKWDWEEDEGEAGDEWVETSEVMRRLADEDYWVS